MTKAPPKFDAIAREALYYITQLTQSNLEMPESLMAIPRDERMAMLLLYLEKHFNHSPAESHQAYGIKAIIMFLQSFFTVAELESLSHKCTQSQTAAQGDYGKAN